jgi:hypothetical protein
VTTAENRDDSRLTLLRAISAFGDLILLMFKTQNKTFEAEKPAEQQLFHGNDYMMKSPEKPFITEISSIDWLQTQFISKTDENSHHNQLR